MNRRSSAAALMVAGIVLGLSSSAFAGNVRQKLAEDAGMAVESAAVAVEEARVSIEGAKALVARIPEDSPLLGEVEGVLLKANKSWKKALSALEGARESMAKIDGASSDEVARDFKLLATVNSSVAYSGAKVVQTSIHFVESVANNKTEALGVIKLAMEDSLAASSQVEANYKRMKDLIAKKYSK